MDSDGSVLAAVSETLHREALELLLASPKGLILLQEGDKRAGSGESLDDIDDSFPEEPVTEAGACSMSGFGTGIANKDNITVKVDIKSLNGRYFDASVSCVVALCSSSRSFLPISLPPSLHTSTMPST